MSEAALVALGELLCTEWERTKRLLLSFPGVSWSEIEYVLPGFNIESYSLALIEPTEEQLQGAARAFALIPFSIFARKSAGLGGASMVWLNRESPNLVSFNDEGRWVVTFHLRGGWQRCATMLE